VVVHSYNLSTWEAEDHEFETSLSYIWRLSQNKQKPKPKKKKKKKKHEKMPPNNME
jgi:hypothetical protein